jgi:hypothetical protein
VRDPEISRLAFLYDRSLYQGRRPAQKDQCFKSDIASQERRIGVRGGQKSDR